MSHKLLVRLALSGGRRAEGLVDDVRIDDAGCTVRVDFPPSAAPRLPIGEPVPMMMVGKALGEPIKDRGIVTFRSEDDFRHRYEFALRGEAQSVLGSALSRRTAVRVKPRAEKPLDLRLVAHEASRPVKAIVQDVSISGIAALVPLEGEAVLFEASTLDVRIWLPHDNEPTEFVALVRYRRLSGSAIQYGLAFDDDETPEFESRKAKIHEYVMQREAESLKESRDRSERAA